MILVDSSIWIDHLRSRSTGLTECLHEERVLAHPFVIGELACGNLKQRALILGMLQRLPAAQIASNKETLYFIEANRLAGRGIGWVDAHLLASTAMTPAARLWTADRQLRLLAEELGLAA